MSNPAVTSAASALGRASSTARLAPGASSRSECSNRTTFPVASSTASSHPSRSSGRNTRTCHAGTSAAKRATWLMPPFSRRYRRALRPSTSSFAVTTSFHFDGSTPRSRRNASASFRTAAGRSFTPTLRPGSGARHASSAPAATRTKATGSTRRSGGAAIGTGCGGAAAGGSGGVGSAALSNPGSSTNPPRRQAPTRVTANGNSSAPTPTRAVTTR